MPDCATGRPIISHSCTSAGTVSGLRPERATTTNGFSARTSRRAISRMPSASGAAGRATPSCAMVGNFAPLILASDTSRGSVRYTGPQGSVQATCKAREIISPALSCICMRWSHLVYCRTMPFWSKLCCSQIWPPPSRAPRIEPG